MADKEATVFVIDLGSSMGECKQGRKENSLEWSLRYVWDKINAKVISHYLLTGYNATGFEWEEDRYGWRCWIPYKQY
jgi:hypothetical protein